ncbi:hypothetical protein BURKHO8Y_40073 [Burkholderia sp. 8Y]|nr:hypothetical protein BURKHO8Y_40073 [Burkholderia sp. 8Y]
MNVKLRRRRANMDCSFVRSRWKLPLEPATFRASAKGRKGKFADGGSCCPVARRRQGQQSTGVQTLNATDLNVRKGRIRDARPIELRFALAFGEEGAARFP